MEDLKRYRSIKKSLEAEYGISSPLFVEVLSNYGIAEITDCIREKISFLQTNCDDFSFQNHSAAEAVAGYSLETLKERRRKYAKILGEPGFSVRNLMLSEKQLDQYMRYFEEIGLNETEKNQALTSIIKLGNLAKTEGQMRKDTECLRRLRMDDNSFRKFISENADYLYNDFSRNISDVIQCLLEKEGREKAIEKLEKHPDLLRWGAAVK